MSEDVDKQTSSISGTCLMLDDKTPHVALVVQVVKPVTDSRAEPTVVATTLSDENGDYQLAGIPSGQYQVRCYTLSGYAYYQDGQLLKLQSCEALSDIDLLFAPFKKGVWRHYTTHQGLAHNSANQLYLDRDGSLWITTDGAGVSRYDGADFLSFIPIQGAVGEVVWPIYRDPEGILWLGTWTAGLVRYDGSQFTTFIPDHTLVRNGIFALCPDAEGNLWLSISDHGVACFDGSTFKRFTTQDGLPHNMVYAIHCDSEGVLWFGTGSLTFGSASRQEADAGGGIVRYNGTQFTTLTTQDGLAADTVLAIHQTPDGILWFGTTKGVSRYDGQTFVNYSTEDGLVSNVVWSIAQDAEQTLWFGTGSGLSRYDGKGFVNFVTSDGLLSDWVKDIQLDGEGRIWLASGSGVPGAQRGGLSCYDPKGPHNWTQNDGLRHTSLTALCADSKGILWIGTQNGHIHRYEASQFTAITPEDSDGSPVSDICLHPDGSVWFGTGGVYQAGQGVFRYDGKALSQWTVHQGLPDNNIHTVCADLNGAIWLGTGKGVVRYGVDGWQDVPPLDHLSGQSVLCIFCDSTGVLWFGTWQGVFCYDGTSVVPFELPGRRPREGVHLIRQLSNGDLWFSLWWGGICRKGGDGELVIFTREDGLANSRVWVLHEAEDGLLWFGTDEGLTLYDGVTWMSIDSQDGLAGDAVYDIQGNEDGGVWLATDGGLSWYRRHSGRPSSHITSVTLDRQYTQLDELPAAIVGRRITVQYGGIDFSTLPQKRQYRCHIQGMDADWCKPTSSTQFEWTPEEPGQVSIAVQCIDRNLNYSEPAILELEVIPDPRDAQIAELESELERRNRELEAELADARDMQMRLMPEYSHAIAGAEIAGKCVTANTVGGDFFDYLAGNDHQVGLVVADVSGKAMRGAMNAVMAAGIVRMAVEDAGDVSPGFLMSRANTTLATSMESDINVTMVIGLLDTKAMTLTLANAAHHAHPLLVRDGEVQQLKARGLPLGMRAGVDYREETFDLQPSDILVLMTDGIIEAHGADGRMYGDSGRLEQMLTGSAEVMAAESMVDALIQDAIEYAGEREDDMTVLVAKMA